MKIYKRQSDRLFNPLLRNIISLGKIVGLLIVLNFAALSILFAQTSQPIAITGQVLGEGGAPAAGATVQVKKSNVSTTTNSNGSFSITVPSKSSVLVFTYVGYEPQEAIAGNNTLSIQLKATSNSLGEVVVVGYGTQKRTSVTGAVDKVGSAMIADRPVANITQALQGTSPGLIIQQRTFQPVSGALNINIRGTGTINNNDPLIVIDGIIGGDLNLLNPNDIDNVSVLKDAGAAAIYGSRSANGVILVTTKKGRKNQKPSITYSGQYGIQTPRYTFKQVHGWEDAQYKNISLANSGKPAQYTDAQIAAIKAQGDGDWRQNTIMQNSPQQSHNITLSGGGANSTFLLSAGYFDQESMLIGPDYGLKRFNIRLNQSTTYGKFTLNSIFSYVKGIYKEPSAGTEGIIGDATRAPLIYSFTDASGNYVGNPTVGNNNPKAILEKGGYLNSNNDEINGNFMGEYVVSSHFKVRGVFGGTVRANTQFQRQVNLVYNGGSYGGDRQVYDRNTKSLFTNTQLLGEYNNTWGKHELTVLFGGTNESFKSEGNGAQKRQTDSLLGIPTTGTTLTTGTDPNSGGTYNSVTNTSESSLNSLLGRILYSYNNKYFLEGNFRYDGSSNFAEDNRWGFFPSIGGKWRVSEENFMSGYRDRVGDLMLRATYGELGSQGVNPYQYLTSYSTNGNVYGFGGAAVSGAQINVANQDLTWEKAASYNLGIDATFFQRKLTFTFEYYHKMTSDILGNREDVPGFYGIGASNTSFPGLPTYNVSKVMSKGWEATVNYNLRGKKFNHSFMFNMADNQNELVTLSGDVQEYEFKREEFWFVRRVGLPITTYRGYLTNGLYQTTDELTKYPKIQGNTVGLGDQKYVDVNGDGKIDPSDRVNLGNPFPRYNFGFTYNVTFKGFDAMVFIQGVGKRDALIRGELLEAYHYGYSGTIYEHQTDFWRPDNTGAKYPRIAENGSASNSNNYKIGSDVYLFDAAYARLKNIQIGYSLPAPLLAKIHMQRARIYFSGQNLITVSKQKIIDPEQSEFNNRLDINSGANSARAYPTPIYYGAGLDITF